MAAEYTHIINEISQKPGQVHLDYFSKICAIWITAGFDEVDYVVEEAWEHTLAACIFNVIRESEVGLSATIVALSFIERYQAALSDKGDCVFYDTAEGAGRLFIAAYMGAVKTMNDTRSRMSYWMRVTNYQYTRADLTALEMKFYDVIQWNLTVERSLYARIYGEMKDAYCRVERRFGAPKIVLLPSKEARALSGSDNANAIEEVPRFGEELYDTHPAEPIYAHQREPIYRQPRMIFTKLSTRTIEPLAAHQLEQNQSQPRVVFPKACYLSEQS